MPEPEGISKLAWPPTREDLERLYLDERLSAAKIAVAYGLKTGNPRSAAYLVTYHLKRHGIEMRDRVEELRKRTEEAVADWRVKHPEQLAGRPEASELAANPGEPHPLTPEESAVIELLRTPGLSIEHLDAETKRRVRIVVEELHLRRRVSLTDIAELIGNKTSGYVSWMARELGIKPREFEEARLEGVHKKVRKYERRPFDGGDEDRAYLLGVSHGDFHVSRPFGDAVGVSTSTTHPAFAELFARLFSPYGHVYRYPRFKRDTRTYEWNVSVILDASFSFLAEARQACREWISREGSTKLAYLAGLIDAEGHIRIYPNPRTVGIIISVWNTDLDLLWFAFDCLRTLGYRPMQPYLDKRKGGKPSVLGIERRKDYWRLQMGRFDESQSVLRRLPLRHQEKLDRRALALSLSKGEPYDGVRHSVSTLSKSFKDQAREFAKQAELQVLLLAAARRTRS